MAFRKSSLLLVLVVAAQLGSCGRSPARAPDQPQIQGGEAEYAAPPAATEVRASAKGVTVGGTAPDNLQVRLATPGGEAVFAKADAQGRWRIALPPAGETRIFGLSEKAQGRQVQAQGYVVIAPDGRSALLRSGAGAVRLDPRKAPSLGALDFDRDGAAVVSGTAEPGTVVYLRLDGRPMAQGRADASGQYSLSLPQPQDRTPAITPGEHRIEATGEGFSLAADVAVSPPAPLVDGPMRSQFTKGGLRVDWMTPGGGVQSTLLLD